MSGYGDTSDPKAQAAYEAAQSNLAEIMDNCPYCKRARKLAGPKWDARWERGTTQRYSLNWTAPDGTRSINGTTRQDAIDRAGCAEHRSRRHLNFVCSPVSEACWAN
jgi:hypothetical protein